jgi:hypothetical protein
VDNKVKAEIITDFVVRNSEDEAYSEFFAYNDLGIPLAVAYNAGLCTLNDEGSKMLDETYELLCAELEADPKQDFEDLDDLLDNIE